MRVFLSSGGTGGHIFPAESLADELVRRGHKVTLITDDRYQNFLGNQKSFEVFKILSATFKGGIKDRMKAVGKILLGIWQSLQLLKFNKDSVVVGFGGYPSFPALIAASIFSMRTIIHEQNSVLGLANRVLSFFVDVIATSFTEVKKIPAANLSKEYLIGNPVRQEIINIREQEYKPAGDVFNLLVIGGSLGAAVFSKVIPQAVAALPVDLKSKLFITQQCREEDIQEAGKIYAENNIKAVLAPFIKDIPEKLASAHLVIARAGASTVSELAVAGRPAILVPYPHAKDNHQYYNARMLENVGGGWIIEQDKFTPDSLKAKMAALLASPEKLESAAKEAKSTGKPDATKKLADFVEKMASTDKTEIKKLIG